jgi:hypothetical protein
MTSVDWLESKLDIILPLDFEWDKLEKIFEQAKEMHKQEIIDAYYQCGRDNFEHIKVINRSATEYYDETYRKNIVISQTQHNSPKDENKDSFGKIKFTEEEWDELNNGSKGSDEVELPQTEISDESWEGCDGCTEQDEVMYKNGYVKGYNAAIADLPKEISDEEIEKASEITPFYYGFIEGAKWYREQLKLKNNDTSSSK